MAATELTVIPYDHEKHGAAQVRFLGEAFDAEKVAARKRVLDWMFAAMPGRDRAPLRHVIMDGDRVAASMGHLPVDFLIKGEVKAVRFTHDLLVDPRYRGKGLAKRIVENSLRYGDFLPGGMWMNEACYKIHLASGFTDMPPLVTQTLVLDTEAFTERKEMSGLKGAVARATLDVVRARTLRSAAAGCEEARRGRAKPVDRFDPAKDGAWLELLKGYGIARIRDAAWLNWKYIDHPNLDYRGLVAEKNGNITGYLIWRKAPASDPEKRAVVVDFLVAHGDARTLKCLLAPVIVEAAEAKMAVLSILTTQPWAIKLLRTMGFFPRGARHWWVIGGWRGVIPEDWASDPAAWHMCMGDSDGDIWTYP
jgi:GNAT superfamily N-acetyltransferase